MLLLFFIGIPPYEERSRRGQTILQPATHVNTLTRKRYKDIKDDLDAKLRAETERLRRERRKARDDKRRIRALSRQALIDERKAQIDGSVIPLPQQHDFSIANRVQEIIQRAQYAAAVAHQLEAQDEDEAIALLLLNHG